MPFTYPRTIHFADTDAAGVVYFANILSICHEAYEASLAAAGINLKTFFRRGEVILPIVHAEVDCLQPMFCGDRHHILLQPTRLSDQKFEIRYSLQPQSVESQPDLVARALTVHLCIASATNSRTDLPPEINHWLDLIQIKQTL